MSEMPDSVGPVTGTPVSRRPAALTALAVLTLAAGVLALGLAGVALLTIALSGPTRGARLRMNSLLFAPYEVARVAAASTLGGVYLVAGLGLLRRQAWARGAVLVAAVAVLVLYPLALLVQVAWVAPTLEAQGHAYPNGRWEYEVPTLDPAAGMAVIALAGGGLVLACHALAALAVLLAQPVREALGGRGTAGNSGTHATPGATA